MQEKNFCTQDKLRMQSHWQRLCIEIGKKKSGLDLKWNKNADHYYSTRYLTKAPYWAKDKAATHKIRNHKFYKLKKWECKSLIIIDLAQGGLPAETESHCE